MSTKESDEATISTNASNTVRETHRQQDYTDNKNKNDHKARRS